MDHLDMSDLQRLRDATASVQDVRRFGAHLQECAACTERARVLFQSDARALEETFANDTIDEMLHPEDELASLVDGTLDAERRMVIEKHLAVCRTCRDEVDDLRAFVHSIQVRSRRPRVAVWMAAAAAALLAITLLIARNDQAPALSASQPPPSAQPTVYPPKTAAVTPASGDPQLSRNPQWQALVDDALRTGRLPLNDEVRRFSAADTYRGATEATSGDVYPTGTAIMERQPTFEWPASAGARYDVTIVKSNGEVVESSGSLTSPRWQPTTPLSRGQVYRWQVRVQTASDTLILPAPPAPPALIRILDDAEVAELREARRTHADDHLLLALLHARAGVIDETRHQLEQYALKEKTVAHRFLQQLPNG